MLYVVLCVVWLTVRGFFFSLTCGSLLLLVLLASCFLLCQNDIGIETDEALKVDIKQFTR